MTDTAVVLKDLASTNGSFVERVPVTEFQILNGQHVQFGAVGMMFESSIAPVLPRRSTCPPPARIVLANPACRTAPPPPPPVPTGGAAHQQPPGAYSGSHAINSHPASVPARPMTRWSANQDPKSSSPRKRPIARCLWGVVGAIGGGLVGMFGWYFMIVMTHTEFSYFAILVGAKKTGEGARMLAWQGSSLKGIVCAICALFAIIIGQYFALVSIVDKVEYLVGKEYKKEMKLGQVGRRSHQRHRRCLFPLGSG